MLNFASIVNLIYCFVTVNHKLTDPGKMVKLCLLFMENFKDRNLIEYP